MYDYLIVGAGLFGSIFSHEAKKRGKKCLVIDKRDHIGGNCFTETISDIHVHKYGPHIFHTSNQNVWEYINQFVEFNNFINSPIANYHGKLYNLPFNMNTFYALWGVRTPLEAKQKIEEQKKQYGVKAPKNLEEQAISLVGMDIYNTLIKEYTEKQWGRSARELPAFIIQRLPVRFTYDNNYFNDRYQGIPIGGYTRIFEKLLHGIEIKLQVDFFQNRSELEAAAKKIVYTGMIDQYYDYVDGILEYRSLRFEQELLDIDNFQGSAIVNYTTKDIPYTRSIEHKHFELGTQGKTVVTREYPREWTRGEEPYYPVNDQKNTAIAKKYLERARQSTDVLFGGRLADYKYYDMHHVVAHVLKAVKTEFGDTNLL
jgi:UDP-galactopyranose mutase